MRIVAPVPKNLKKKKCVICHLSLMPTATATELPSLRVRERLNHSTLTLAKNSTAYKNPKNVIYKKKYYNMCHLSSFTYHMSCVTLYVSRFTCLVSLVTCHLSLTPTAKTTDPPPANSPGPLCTLHSRLVYVFVYVYMFILHTVLYGRPKLIRI